MPTRQKRRPIGGHGKVSGAGVGVDQYGGPAIDPTENVLSLVDAESRHRDSLRAADNKYQDDMRDAETRRINELRAQKQTFDMELARVLRANQEAASTLLATQLQEVKRDLADRTSKLEQFRWETGGKSSVADPATDAALARMTSAITNLTKSETTTAGKALGRGEIIAYIAIGVAVLGAAMNYIRLAPT
jgi:hypothetical protein